ncbi:THAP domain-containing protein 5 [Salmo salar]|uniref:THAP domain-containing protein 5 n=1 Tax=Salmo salar TaxID=8030 RepID=A0A1S3T2V8_SALSA|nr:THAP domain-containing protein 5 [Salmo salar]|eukprot:XP_014070925.1 PREDICTED: THAP domain-containing protein 5-like [Salmo salar]
MPKYCSAPNCKNDSGNNNSDRKSFYKFPLQDPARLEQWLKNMGREDWSPSRHQYICHEHFASSSFKLRWGIRYLENNAVPTVFQLTEKRKGEEHGESQKSKRLRRGRKPRTTSSDVGMPASDSTDSDNTLTLYEVTVNPSATEEAELLEERDVTGHTVDLLHTAPLPLLASEGRSHDGAAGGFPVTVFQTVEDLGGLDGEVVVSQQLEEVVSGVTAAILTEGHDLGTTEDVGNFVLSPTSLVMENVSPEMEEELSVSQDDHGGGAQIIAYFETIPNILSSGAAQFSIPSDTVLSSALSPSPIVSTLPIVSKHMPPSPQSLILTLERLATEEGETPEEDHMEQQGSQLEEHRYNKNNLSKEQLEAIVIELQKKVKVLQQRHRRHLDKLVGLENTVNQLRQNNLLNEERVHLLERVCIQTSAAVSEAGETVAIIYEQDNTAYLYDGSG